MRLIDADELSRKIREERSRGFPANEDLTIYALSCVSHTPTAYDIDKVMEELEEYKKFIFRNSVMGIDAIKKQSR